MDSMKKAREIYERDAMFRMLARSCAAEAMKDISQDIEYVRADIHDVALRATALLLERIFSEDYALKLLMAERDQYKALAERFLSTTPPRVVLQASDIPQTEDGAPQVGGLGPQLVDGPSPLDVVLSQPWPVHPARQSATPLSPDSDDPQPR